MSRVVGLLLAGGASTRFGGNKLTAMHDGIPVGIRAARNLRDALGEICVVVPVDRPDTVALFADEFPVSVCADARQGIGRSIAHGVTVNREAEGWFIALADMPAIATATMAALGSRLTTPTDIIRPYYHGHAGHPVGFGANYAEELMALQGDSGAAGIVRRYPDALARFDVDDAGVVYDVDTPADLERPTPLER